MKLSTVLIGVAKRTIGRTLDRSLIYAADSILQSKGYSGKRLVFNKQKADAARVTSRTGRLLRSVTGARGENGGGKEGIRSANFSNGKIEVVYTNNVPYSAPLEYGSSAHDIPITPRMRKFFWAMHYAEGKKKNTMWKHLALKRGSVHIPAQGERPYIRPGIRKAIQDMPMVLKEELEKLK